jgi:hypothetical protein
LEPIREKELSMRKRGFYSLAILTLLLLAGATLACRAPEPEPAATKASTPTPAASTACAVDDGTIRQWIQNPSLPSDPAGMDNACFWNFAWQELFDVAQLQGTTPQFATWPNDQELFPLSGDPRPWQAAPRRMKVRLLRKALGMPGSGGVVVDQVAQAAALTPVVDQRGRWAHYSIVVDHKEYDYVRCCELYRGGCFNTQGGVATNPPGPSQIRLPTGSLELKLAWRVLETCHLPDSPQPCTPEDASRFLTVQGDVEPYSPSIPKVANVTLGLVGVHIVQRTPEQSGSVWATFEHQDNDPDCAAASNPPPPAGWQFYNPACNPADIHCQANAYCPPEPITVPADVTQAFNADSKNSWKIPVKADGTGEIVCTPAPNEFNQPVKVNGQEVWIHLFDPASKAAPIPSQVCRQTPVDPQVSALNDQVHQVLGQLGGGARVFANYRLVGVLWSDSPTDVEPAGATKLANTTMETYLQPLPTGCLLCHAGQNDGRVNPVNAVPSKPPMQYNSAFADRSFLFQQTRQFGGSCSANQPAKCSAWAQGCPAR